MYISVPNKLYGQFLIFHPKYFILLKTFTSEFSYIEIWFTDQDSKPVAATQPLHTVIQIKNINGLQFSNTVSVIFNRTQLINICSDTIAKIVTNNY